VRVALAAPIVVPIQDAANPVLRIDDRPVAVDLHALQLGIVLAAACGLGVLALAEVEAGRIGVKFVVPGDRHELFVRQQFCDETAEGGIERRIAAGRIGEEGAAAWNEVAPQGDEVLVR
jgi:hypothetical protein